MMYFCSKIAILVFALFSLCLPRISISQNYYPGDWSGPTLVRVSFAHSESGTGNTGISSDGSYVDAVTAVDGDYAYATQTCTAVFAHLVSQNENFFGVINGFVTGEFGANGYGHSTVEGGGTTIVSDTGQNNHDYGDFSPLGFGPLPILSTETQISIEFRVTAQCHDGAAKVVALGDVDKNVD